jgi:hypothetical protein
MKYVSGPHTGDYYLLLDEQSDAILATRLAEHAREACGTADLVEMWVDDNDKQVWYLFER